MMKQPGAYRVVHTADWHLGKTLVDLSREEEHAGFLAFLLEVIREQEVDALVIAGDVFDSSHPPQSAQSRYYDFLSTLYRTTECAVVVVAGNHDSPAQLDAPRQVLGALRVRVVGAVAEDPGDALLVLPDREHPQLLVAAVPFLRDRDVRTGQSGQSATEIQAALVAGIRRRYDDIAAVARDRVGAALPVLATGHLTVAGSATSDSEREIHVGGLGAVGADMFSEVFSYVALGHLHRPQAAGKREEVRYSGSPIPLSFSEAGDGKELRVLDFVGAELVGNVAVAIPLRRHLVQLRGKRSELEEKLRSFQPPAGELATWVEVLVDDPVPGENLFEIVREYAGDGAYTVVRVVGRRTVGPQGLTESDGLGEAVESSVLEDPNEVFRIRLEREVGLEPDERTAVETLFRELRELHDGERRGDVPAWASEGDGKEAVS